MEKETKSIAILVLAAGSSSRLGRPKQLLEINGKTLLQKSIETALVVSKNVTVVLGANEELIRPTISGFPINIVLNENHSEGMSSSIKTGMISLEEKKLDGVLIMVCDQPFVDIMLLKGLVAVFEKNKVPIVASQYENKVGVPAIFGFSFFKKLKDLKGQKGAKALIMSNIELVERVVFDKGEIDIDTEEDWGRFKNLTL